MRMFKKVMEAMRELRWEPFGNLRVQRELFLDLNETLKPQQNIRETLQRI